MPNTKNQRVLTLLKSLGISEMELAKRTGKQPSIIYRITRKQTEPTGTTLQLIADACGANYNWLLTGHGEMLNPDPKSPAPSQIGSIDNAINSIKEMLTDQIRVKDEQIAGLMQLLQKVNFLKSAQKPDREAVLIDLKQLRAVLPDVAA